MTVIAGTSLLKRYATNSPCRSRKALEDDTEHQQALVSFIRPATTCGSVRAP